MIITQVYRRVACLLGLAAVLFVPAPPAIAQTGPELTALRERVSELYRAGKYGEAVPLAEQYVAAAKSRHGEEHRRTGTALVLLARLYRAQGRYLEAEPLLRRALVIAEQAHGPDHVDVGKRLYNLGVLYSRQRRYAEAEPLLKRALAIAEQAHGPDHVDVGRRLYYLGLLHAGQGNYLEAEPPLKRALAIAELAYGPDHVDVGRRLYYLGLLYDRQGSNHKAEPLLRRALAIAEQAYGPDHPEVARRLNSLAGVYHNQGNDSDIEPILKRSLAIFEEARGPDHPHVGTLLKTLGQFYFEHRRYAEAEPLFTRSLAIAEKTREPDHPVIGLSSLGQFYLAQRRNAEAEPLLRRALAIAEQAYGPDHPEVGTHLNDLALLFEHIDRHGEAEQLYQRALDINEKALGPNDFSLVSALSNLTGLYQNQHKWNLAFIYAQRAINIVIKEARLASEVPDEGVHETSSPKRLGKWSVFRWLVLAAWPLAVERPDQREELTEAAFSAAQWANRGATDMALGQMSARFVKGQGPLADLVHDLQSLNDERGLLEQRVVAAVATPPQERDRETEKALRRRLSKIEGRLKDLNRRLKVDFPEYYALASPEPLTIAEAQAELKTDEVLIQFLPAGPDIFAWAITKNASRWVRLADVAKVVPDQVRALRCGLDADGEWTTNEQRSVAEVC